MKRIKRFIGELINVRNGSCINLDFYGGNQKDFTWDLMLVAKNMYVAYIDPGKSLVGKKVNYSVWAVITKEGIFSFQEKLLVKGVYLVLSTDHIFIHVKEIL